jgi:hypothetical protein
VIAETLARLPALAGDLGPLIASVFILGATAGVYAARTLDARRAEHRRRLGMTSSQIEHERAVSRALDRARREFANLRRAR